MKTLIERGLRRSGLPVKFTEGFNKRVKLELGFPLSVGMVGEDEYFDFFLDEPVDASDIFNAIRTAFDSILEIKRVKLLPYSAKAITSFEAIFTYTIFGHFEGNSSCEELSKAIQKILLSANLFIERDGKTKDVRKFIEKITLHKCETPSFELISTIFYLKDGSIKMSELEGIFNNYLQIEFEYEVRKSTLIIDEGKLISPFDVSF